MVFSETQTRRWFSGWKCFEWTWPEKKSVLNEHEIVFEWKKKVHNKINFKFVLVVEEDCKSKCSCVNFLSILFVFICRNYMNDSFRTEVFVRFQPETIACACIYLAARQLQVCSKYNIEFYTNYEFKAISKMDNKVHSKYMYVLTDSDTLFHRFHCQIILHGSPSSMWMKATYRKSVSLS